MLLLLLLLAHLKVQVHAGFLKAWLHDGFNKKVLARLQELEAATATPLRFWIAGERPRRWSRVRPLRWMPHWPVHLSGGISKHATWLGVIAGQQQSS